MKNKFYFIFAALKMTYETNELLVRFGILDNYM